MSLVQIYAALGYYHDHRDEFDDQIARDEAEISGLWRELGETPGQKKLRALGRLP